MLVGMLLSARSTKHMFATARARAAHRQAKHRALDRMTKRGLISMDDRETLHLTKAGSAALERSIVRMRSDIRDVRTVWDGKWRLAAFDIPEIMRGARDALRFVLKRAGFLQLQQSIWIYPYDCGELQLLLVEDQKLRHRVVYVRIDLLNDEKNLLEHFGLSRNRIRKE